MLSSLSHPHCLMMNMEPSIMPPTGESKENEAALLSSEVEAAKGLLRHLSDQETTFDASRVLSCFQGLADLDQMEDEWVQEMLTLFFSVLFSMEVEGEEEEWEEGEEKGEEEEEEEDRQEEPRAEEGEQVNYIPFRDIEPFLPLGQHLNAANKKHIKGLAGGLITELLLLCPSSSKIEDTVIFCRRLCKAFGFSQGNIIPAKEIRHEISDVLNKRFPKEALKEAQDDLRALGVSLNPQKNRKGKLGEKQKRGKENEEQDKNMRRLMARIESPRAGGGSWRSA